MSRKVAISGGSAFTILNAIPAWKGIAVGLDIRVRVEAEISDADQLEAEDKDYVRFLVEKFRNRFGIAEHVHVRVYSEIPPRSGLKSSNAVAACVILALAALFRPSLRVGDCLRLAAWWSREYGASVTGALDDTAASTLGGVVYTDNKTCTLEKHEPAQVLEVDDVLVVIPRTWTKPDRNTILRLRHYAKLYEKLYYTALSRPERLLDIAELNSYVVSCTLGYDLSLLKKLKELTRGSHVLLSGNGPAVIILNPDEEKVKQNLEKLGSLCTYFRQAKVRDVCLEWDQPVSEVVSSLG